MPAGGSAFHALSGVYCRCMGSVPRKGAAIPGTDMSRVLAGTGDSWAGAMPWRPITPSDRFPKAASSGCQAALALFPG